MERRGRSSIGSGVVEVDRVCGEFENSLRQGRNPRIEDYLGTLPPEVQRVALQELLGLELDYRRQHGEPIDRSVYESRFPNDRSIVAGFEHLFASHTDATTADPSPDRSPETATTSVRYRDLRLFRRGGLGVLYRAQDESLHRDAVVKFMNDQCAAEPALVSQFKVEAELTSRLDHPGIVPVYGIGEDWRGRPFYVMRLVNGREMKEVIAEYHSLSKGMVDERRRRESLFALLDHLIDACNTIAYTHHVGVIHCDIKPANIMIGKYGETFVLDWGLAGNFNRVNAQFTPNEVTMRPQIAGGSSTSTPRGGTYGYISPEQLRGDESLGPATDIYSLGATLYEILTGQPPFDGRDPDVRERIRLGKFPAPRVAEKGVCRPLEAVCLKAMSLNPKHRYATAKDLADDIMAAMRDEETVASPDGWVDRIFRFARRHRGVTAAFFTSLLTIVVAVAWTDRTAKIASHEKAMFAKSEELREIREKTAQSERQSLERALVTLEGLCRPFASGEISNMGVIRPVVDKIKTYAGAYLDEFADDQTMRFHTARMYDLRAVARSCSGEIDTAIDDLTKAEAFYIEAAEDKESRPKVDPLLTQNLLSQARLFLQLDNLDEASKVLDNAADRLVRLAKASPEDDDLRRMLAEARHGQGEVLLYRPFDGAERIAALLKAEDAFDQGKVIRKQLVEVSTGDRRRDHVRDLARSYGYLGDVYLAQGKITRAAEVFEESRKLREELFRGKQDDPEYRFQYARALGNFARLNQGYRGDWTAAIKDFEQCESLQGSLAVSLPDVASIAIDLGGTLNNLAESRWILAHEAGSDRESLVRDARAAAERAIEVFGPLARRQHPSGAPGLARGKIAMAAMIRADDPEESRRMAEEAKRLLRSIGPEQTLPANELVTLALTYAELGELAESLHALEAAVDRGENTPARFESLAKLEFKAVAADPQLGPRLKALLEKIRANVTLE